MNVLKKSAIVMLIVIGLIVYFLDSGETEYRISDNEVYLKVTSNTTDSELLLIQTELMELKNISLDYSKSTFNEEGELRELNLDVDCNDGYSGQTNTNSFGLLISSYGFSQVRGENGEITFKIGSI